MDVEVLRARFVRTFAKVPTKLRDEIICLVDDKPYNWNSAYIAITGKTPTGDEIIKKLDQIGLLEPE
jgi:hypothetical protein